MTSRREGFTLVELLIVTVLGAVVMGSIFQMITIQDRTTQQQYAIVQNNQNARMTLAVLTSDLKEMSARDGDVAAADSTYLQFRALRKAGVACFKDAGNNYIDVMELGDAFAAQDSVLVFADGANTTSALDDTWLVLRVNSVGAGACAANPLGAANIRRLNFGGSNPLAEVATGALVRSFIHTKYELIDSNGFGVLRRTEGNTAIPIIDGLATTAEGGMHIRYIDSTSTVIPYSSLGTNGVRRRDIMRMQVKIRGKSVVAATTQGNRFTDSLVTQIYVRGNARSK